MKQFSEQDQEALLDILRRHEQKLKAFKGVHYVDVGYKFINGKPTDELAIRVHVGEKKPERELEAAQVLPTNIEGIPIDVIQSNPGLEQNRDNGICQWKLDTLLNNLDSKGRVDICFG